MLLTEADMRVRLYQPGDLDWVTTATPDGWFDAASIARAARLDLSVSFYQEDAYCGSAGLIPLWPGVYEAWFVLAQAVREPWILMAAIRRSLLLGIRLTQAHRIQAYCMAEYLPGRVLARRLGFTQEAVLQAATPTKTNLILFAKVRR